MKLKDKYKSVCDEYVEIFCKKQELDFEYWVANIVGDIAVYGDYFFNFQDIVWDINSNQPKGRIIDWYNESLENPKNSINYFSYTKSI